MTDILMCTIRDGRNHVRSLIGSSGEHPQRVEHSFETLIELHINAQDFQRGILHVRETLMVGQRGAGAGSLTVLYPEWLPGYHAPDAPLELIAGLRFCFRGAELQWQRDPVVVHAFHVSLPDEADHLEIEFQLLCPTAEEQGRVGFTSRHLNLQWNTVVLYPAGYVNSQVGVLANIDLPQGWSFACALETVEPSTSTNSFAIVPLDWLVDSPLFAGAHYRRYDLGQKIALNVFGDQSSQIAVGEQPLSSLRNLIEQADHLFGARPFDHYELLIAVSEELGALGVEHHQSAEMVVPADFFSDWEGTASRNAVIAHEYVHSWNGKYRRGKDSCTQSFDAPIQNSLMWVYEGLTQYWGEVLATRSGLWSVDRYIGLLAQAAGKSALVKGRSWRPVADTTRDPIIASRKPLPWLSWQRSEDYYSDGKLMWLDVDTLVRELTNDRHSLDDFGRAFFGSCQGRAETRPYTMDDVVSALDAVAPFDWRSFFERHLTHRGGPPPFDGIHRAGYQLVFRDEPNEYHRAADKSSGILDFSHSLGLLLDTKGKIKEVIWDSPSFYAGLTAGCELIGVNGWKFSQSTLEAAVKETPDTGVVRLTIRKLKRCEDLEVLYSEGARHPHLIPNGQSPRMSDIVSGRP